jgi:hypothetical protein
MSQAQTNALIWSDKKSTDSSREAYFGSITAGDEVIYVQKVNFIDQPDLWEIRWNAGCHPVRKPQNPQHADLYDAIAEADAARLLGPAGAGLPGLWADARHRRRLLVAKSVRAASRGLSRGGCRWKNLRSSFTQFAEAEIRTNIGTLSPKTLSNC